MKSIARRGQRTRAKPPVNAKSKRPNLHETLLGAGLSVDRAGAELRRGLPVVMVPSRGAPSLIAAAELASDDVCLAMAQWSGASLHVLLTHQRATTLKIRLYTDELVAVALPGDDLVHAAQVLADPTRDLRDPLMGPWNAARTPLSGSAVAAARLSKIAGLLPAIIEVPISARVAKTMVADEGLQRVKAADVIAFDAQAAVSLKIVARAQLPLADAADTRVLAFRPANGGREHLALVVGSPEPPGPVLVRLHSECLTGDLLGSLKCDCGDQLRGAIAVIGKAGAGVLLYLAQEGRGIGLINKLKAYELQDQGFDTIEANQRLGFEADEREFAMAAEILKTLGFSSVRLLTNNPYKVAALEAHGIRVTERVAHHFPANPHNEAYMATKKAKAGHLS
jgi:GTP cyclohydrolase II